MAVDRLDVGGVARHRAGAGQAEVGAAPGQHDDLVPAPGEGAGGLTADGTGADDQVGGHGLLLNENGVLYCDY
ncbi:MAG: hypothetical protein R2731_06725 [Nocardioides sp.]